MVRWTIFLRRAANRLALASALFAFANAAAHAQTTFSPPAKMSADMLATGEPKAAVAQNGNIYVVWSDQASACTASGCSKDVFFSRSTDHGATFSTPLNLSNNTSSTNPLIALDSQSNIDVIWAGGGHLFFSRSADAGTTFSSPLNIAGVTNPSLAFSAGYRPLVVDAAGNINVVWSDQNTSQIFFARSTNAGVSFSTPLNISNYASGASSPTMTVDPSGGIDVVWQGSVSGHNSNDLFFTRSTDAGASFSVAKDISNAPSGAFFDQIAVDPTGAIDVAWNSNCPSPTFCAVVSSDVFFSQSKDGGATFSAPVQVTNTQGQAAISRVLLAIDSAANVNLAWPQVAGGNNTTFFSRLNAGANAFSTPRQIASSFPAAMAVDASGNIDIAAAGTDVYVLQSTDEGNTFSSTNLTNGGTGAGPEAVEVVANANPVGNIAAAWPSYNHSTSKWTIFGSGSAATQTASGGSGTPLVAAGFTVAAAPAALAISAPSLSATTVLTFTSQGGLAGAGALASVGCSSAASQKIACTLTGFTLPANGTATAQLTITSAVSSAAVSPSSRNLLLAALLCLAIVPLAMPRKQRRLNFAFATILFAITISGVGCGSAMNASTGDANGGNGAAKTPAAPKATAQSISVPVTINGTTVTVPNLTLTLQ